MKLLRLALTFAPTGNRGVAANVANDADKVLERVEVRLPLASFASGEIRAD